MFKCKEVDRWHGKLLDWWDEEICGQGRCGCCNWQEGIGIMRD